MKHKLVITVLIMLLYMPYAVSAQEIGSPSAQLESSSLIQSALDSLSQLSTIDLSPGTKSVPQVTFPTQTVFKVTESIPITIENDDVDKITVEAFDPAGEKRETGIEKSSIAQSTIIRINPPDPFKPGKYHLKITDSTGAANEKDILWGILAINTNKSIYQPHELAKLNLTVLDETGKIPCNATIELSIHSPAGQTKKYTTADQTIPQQPTCEEGVTTPASFEINYRLGSEEGSYEMTLTAQILDKTYTITDTLEVKKDLPFSVERVGETHILPFVRYTMLLNVEAVDDFRGEISEVVPEEFEIGAVDTLSDFVITKKPAEQMPEIAPHISFDLPFNGDYRMTQGFGARETDPIMALKYRRYGLMGHDGIDYSMPTGTPIFSVDDGIVVLTEKFGDYGTTVAVQHRWGTSYYGHLSKITKRKGEIVKKGEQIALSGDTGLSTGPHLHFGIKLKQYVDTNGYYGKTNPLTYLTTGSPLLSQVKGIATQKFSSDEDIPPGMQMLTWNVNLKKGEKTQLGYTYLSTAEDQQVYTLPPLAVTTDCSPEQRGTCETPFFEEERGWQVSVDSTDQGSMTISPEKGSIGSSNQQYQFAYTNSESVDGGSGVVTIQIPKGWTAPQTTTWGLPGKITIDQNSTGIIGDVLSTMDTRSGWQTNTACSKGLVISQKDMQEGKGNLTCMNGKEKYGSWYFSLPQSDWTAYTTVGMWVKVSRPLKNGQLQFAYDNNEDLASPLETIDVPEISAADEWTWVTINLDPKISRTKVVSYGFRVSNASSLENTTVSTDYLLMGPGVPTIEGYGPWTLTLPILSIPANNGKIIVNYRGVENPLTEGVYTFTTKAKMITAPSYNFVSLAKQPVVTLSKSSHDTPLNTLWIPRDERQPFSF